MAQLVARLVRNEKVGGSNPPSSTTDRHPIRMSVFVCRGELLLVVLLVFWALSGLAVGPGGYRTLRVAGWVTFRLSGAGKSLFQLVVFASFL